MSKRAIITGITGQDGSYLAELLLSKGYEVVGTVRRASAPRTWHPARNRDRPDPATSRAHQRTLPALAAGSDDRHHRDHQPLTRGTTDQRAKTKGHLSNSPQQEGPTGGRA